MTTIMIVNITVITYKIKAIVKTDTTRVVEHDDRAWLKV